MEQLVRRLERIDRALRASPDSFGCDPRVAEAVGSCLREWRAIAVQRAECAVDARARLRLIDCATLSPRSPAP